MHRTIFLDTGRQASRHCNNPQCHLRSRRSLCQIPTCGRLLWMMAQGIRTLVCSQGYITQFEQFHIALGGDAIGSRWWWVRDEQGFMTNRPSYAVLFALIRLGSLSRSRSDLISLLTETNSGSDSSPMDTAADIARAVDVSTRAISHLHVLITAWRSAPDQLHYLRDDIDRLSSLLETIRQNKKTAQQVTNPSDAYLIREVALARRSLESVQAILHELALEEGTDRSSSFVTESSSSDAKRRHRWILRRDDIARSQRSLQLSSQYILSRLVTLNL